MSSALLPVGDARVRAFDIRNQEVIDRGRIRRLLPVIEASAQRMAGAFSANVRQAVHITVEGFDQKSWDDFRAEMEDPTFIAAASMSGLEGRVALHIPAQLVLTLVDVQLGGKGKRQPDRLVLTDLEFDLLSVIAEDAFAAFQAAVNAFVEVGIGGVQPLRSSIYVKMGRPGEMCLQIQMSVSIADGEQQSMYVYCPLPALHPILEAFERLQRGDDSTKARRWMDTEKRLLTVPVEIQVAYPPIALTTTEVLGLRAGDVVPLHVDKDDRDAQLDIVAGGFCIGKGFLVAKGKRLACTVTSWREEKA
ncbi:MAG: FliM/FliN family flagellar motor switch protein [Acidimicrobiales bacterium]